MFKVINKIFTFNFFKYIKVYYNVIFIYLYNYSYIVNLNNLKK